GDMCYEIEDEYARITYHLSHTTYPIFPITYHIPHPTCSCQSLHPLRETRGLRGRCTLDFDLFLTIIRINHGKGRKNL
ncbi:hypothetical protein KAX29_07590, partial [candidate division WOR-3 bacterium]|nr:hypothetical protein [candidate division WOR-3 bacterium]